MLNPWNGDGLFQIVSHDYGTGAIGVPELLEQTQHFIDFCYAKRAVYKKVRRFDDVPVQITYEGWSLQDLRKQSVLYNGMYARSEEHTSELQSLRHLVCRLLLEKKKKIKKKKKKEKKIEIAT